MSQRSTSPEKFNPESSSLERLFAGDISPETIDLAKQEVERDLLANSSAEVKLPPAEPQATSLSTEESLRLDLRQAQIDLGLKLPEASERALEYLKQAKNKLEEVTLERGTGLLNQKRWTVSDLFSNIEEPKHYCYGTNCLVVIEESDEFDKSTPKIIAVPQNSVLDQRTQYFDRVIEVHAQTEAWKIGEISSDGNFFALLTTKQGQFNQSYGNSNVVQLELYDTTQTASGELQPLAQVDVPANTSAIRFSPDNNKIILGIKSRGMPYGLGFRPRGRIEVRSLQHLKQGQLPIVEEFCTPVNQYLRDIKLTTDGSQIVALTAEDKDVFRYLRVTQIPLSESRSTKPKDLSDFPTLGCQLLRSEKYHVRYCFNKHEPLFISGDGSKFMSFGHEIAGVESGRNLLVGSFADQTAVEFGINERQGSTNHHKLGRELHAQAMSHDGKNFAVIGDNNTWWLFEIEDLHGFPELQVIGRRKFDDDFVPNIFEFAPDGDTLIAKNWQTEVRIDLNRSSSPSEINEAFHSVSWQSSKIFSNLPQTETS